MTIIEALVQLRNDLKLWVANNLRMKVDKEDGKGLSSNDFTTAEKEKLAGLSTEGLATITYVDNTKMDKENPTGTGSFSLNRKVDSTVGDYSVAEGYNTEASGMYSHAEGFETTASGFSSYAEGIKSIASGTYSHAEGAETTASEECSHAEGMETTASGHSSHAEGYLTTASGQGSHAEGCCTTASGTDSHVEGYSTTASGSFSHAEGQETNAEGHRSHAEGWQSVASGGASHAEGFTTIAFGDYSHAEGVGAEFTIKLTGAANALSYTYTDANFPEGVYLFYIKNSAGNYVFAWDVGGYTIEVEEALSTEAISNQTFYCYTSVAFGEGSHVEGIHSMARKDYSHAEGYYALAEGEWGAHAEGCDTLAEGDRSHAEGWESIASGGASHAEGFRTRAKGAASHAEGHETNAEGHHSHAEGYVATASGENSHAEGYFTKASEHSSHAEGYATEAGGVGSHAEGMGTIAAGYGSHVQGMYNIADSSGDMLERGTYAHIVGNGQNKDNRSNAHTLDWQGNAWFAGDIYVGGTSQYDEAAVKLSNIGDAFLPLSGGTLTGPLVFTENVGYGTTLPISPVEGQLFFLDEEDGEIGIKTQSSTEKSYVLGVPASDTSSKTINYNTSVYTSGSVLYGAAWNDYAEYRAQREDIEPGYCVASADNGEVYKTTEKFQACDGIVSDTYGFVIGQTENCKTPLAVAGRVLAYCEGDRYDYHAGDTVCAGPQGKVCKMTREEIREWPDRIIGIVSEIPEYETWGETNISVNNRIWIKVK